MSDLRFCVVSTRKLQLGFVAHSFNLLLILLRKKVPPFSSCNKENGFIQNWQSTIKHFLVCINYFLLNVFLGVFVWFYFNSRNWNTCKNDSMVALFIPGDNHLFPQNNCCNKPVLNSEFDLRKYKIYSFRKKRNGQWDD